MTNHTPHERETIMSASIRTVDVSEWLDWERPDMSTPYEVVAAPMGETIRAAFATEHEARKLAREIGEMTGTYSTSWGEAEIWTQVTINHYVDNSPADYVTPATGAVVSTPDGEGIMQGVTGSLYAVAYPDGIPAIGLAPGSVMGYAPADVTPAPSYSFYVGSTDIHSAHFNGMRAADAFPDAIAREVYNGRIKTYGVWDGETEETAIYEARLADDATAQRIAYAIAILTGNECVMVTRDAFKGESDRAFNSTARYRVSEVTTTEGNRTLIQESMEEMGRRPFGIAYHPGYRFERDVKGDEIAFLVHSDASVTPVSE